MKKIIGSFACGQLLQLLILVVAIRLTYSTNTVMFCAVLGCVSTLMLCVGSGLTSIEMTAPADTDMEEAPEISKHLKVTQTNVKRDDDVKVVERPRRKSWGTRIADAIEADKKTAEPSVMETKLERVGTDA